MPCCVFFIFCFVLTCVDLREVVDTIARSVPQPCAVAMLNHYDQRLSWSRIRLQEKSLNSSFHPRLLTCGSQHWHLDMIFSTNTHPQKFKGTSSCASIFFPLFYVTFHQNRGLHVDDCSGISHEHLASKFSLFVQHLDFFFLFFKNQLWLNYVHNKYSIVCVLKCPALMHLWIIGILTPRSLLLLHAPE